MKQFNNPVSKVLVEHFVSKNPTIAATYPKFLESFFDLDHPCHATNSFVKDVAMQLLKNGSLSENQVRAFVASIQRDHEYASRKVAIQTAACELNFMSIVDLFNVAAKKLKHPKIYMEIKGVKIEFSIAGPTSKNAGCIYVTDGGPYGANAYYGKIQSNGVLLPAKALTPEIMVVIEELAKDPVGYAAQYGHLTGHCCFCHLPLKDPRSMEAGYGEVCSKKWGLPWGKKTLTVADVVQAVVATNLVAVS